MRLINNEKRSRSFLAIPFQLRIILVGIAFLLTTLCVPHLIPLPAEVGFLIILFGVGGWNITLRRMFLLALACTPILFALIITHFTVHQPFFDTYLRALMFLPFAAFALDGVRFEEWLRLLRISQTRRSLLENIAYSLLALGLAKNMIGEEVQEEILRRADVGIRRWKTRRRVEVSIDNVAMPFAIAADGFEALQTSLTIWESASSQSNDSGLRKGQEDKDSLILSNSSMLCSLSDVYDFPHFREFIATVFGRAPISPTWLSVLDRVGGGDNVLEIGPGAGHLTVELIERGLNVTVLERHEGFCKTLADISDGNRRPIIVHGAFPEKLVRGQDYIVLHQNVFLEVINQRGLDETIEALLCCINRGGRIYFDYPSTLKVAEEGVLFNGSLGDGASLSYSYSSHDVSGEVHSAILSYEYITSSSSFAVRGPLEFSLPNLGQIEEVARKHAVTMDVTDIREQFTILPCEMKLICLR